MFPCPAPAPPTPEMGGLQLQPVGAANFEAEVDFIGFQLPMFPNIVIDTEYPGTVHRAGTTTAPPPPLAPAARYALVKANVDELPVVPLGITICDEDGNLPIVADPAQGSRPVRRAWVVHFSDFDALRHRHVPYSVRFLEFQGVDFHRARRYSVASADCARRLTAVLASLPMPWFQHQQLTWVAFRGAYDFAYMVKMLSGARPLPDTCHEFIALAKDLLRGRVLDAKYMAEHSGRADLCVGGLRTVAVMLGVPELHPPQPYLAGPKSYVACCIYTTLRKVVMMHDSGTGYDGLIDGIH